VNEDENLSREIHSLEKKLAALEGLSSSTSIPGSVGPELYSEILKRINNVQNLVDQIEIEIDKLEMRVSAIEQMGFRLRTGP
jgi:UDP-N-acetylenolpyruvoylglucosamine reductase